MDLEALGHEAWKTVQEVLGYLNFSSGAADPTFLRNLNQLFGQLDTERSGEPTWQRLAKTLRAGLVRLRSQSPAFAQAEQAEAAIQLAFDVVLPAYRSFHRDLLFHQTEEALFQPLFIGRVCEVVLAQGGPWNEEDRVRNAAIAQLNDFVGHRPIAVLETGQKMQPYAHEWVRPIPVYIRDAGVAVGRCHDVIQQALEILRATDSDLLDRAWFSPDRLEELAVDPRAYDFDHPVNRRPNYHFGGWDPQHIDQRGYYYRYVLQEVTLEGLYSRVEQPSETPREERLWEAAAVLAGTILMGSGITGSGPESHDSSTTLTTLVPVIAAYRDAFYERLLLRVGGLRGERLREEAQRLRQPFAGARQHLNQTLARRRAEQLQHVHLARLYARMGFTEAATEQARIVPVASARMRTEIDCRLTAGHLALDRKQLEQAAAQIPQIEDLMHRAIECGAMADPWNILGFGGQFSRFPSPEDSVHDERIDDLIELLNELFGLYARLQGESAAAGDDALRERLSAGMSALAQWWDKYASTEVSDVEGVSGRESWQSADQVSVALAAWQKAGNAAGNLAFWREHAEQFRSPKAYALLVESLLEKNDLVAAMALLMHWLGQAAVIPLTEGHYSHHALAMRWMDRIWAGRSRAASEQAGGNEPAERWELARKFFGYLEANAEEFWSVPQLDLAGTGMDLRAEELDDEPEDEDADNLFRAAYENVVYRDTTDDGIEGEMIEWGSTTTDFELSHEAERISRRLAFLVTVARLWRFAAIVSSNVELLGPDRDDALAGWLADASQNKRQLDDLLSAVHRYRIPPPRGTYESLLEYDRHQAIKENLLERIVGASVEMADAVRLVRAAMDRDEPLSDGEPWEASAHAVLRCVFRNDPAALRRAWPDLVEQLGKQPLLYLPLYRGGNPNRIVQSRTVQQFLRRLFTYLPRLGLLQETHQLLEVAQRMERDHPVGPGAITEFDQLFDLACRSIVRCLVASLSDWQAGRSATHAPSRRSTRTLTEIVERAVELLLRRWLAHNRGVRLSVLENVADEPRWDQLRQFIERYGHDLFTQKFLTYGNLRAILHEGTDRYLQTLRDQEGEERFRLIDDLDGAIPLDEAARLLELTIEAVVENYAEYRDYNTTTTQSDRGELLYIFLDFLRLKASYDRVAWNLRPVVIAHEVLLQSGRAEAAVDWRRGIAQRSAPVADEHLQRYEQLCAKYGMRLRSVGDRLGERFVQPLAIDRLRAWVRPASEELRKGQPTRSFVELQREVAPFLETPEGVGLDVPTWLEALEDEVRRVRSGVPEEDEWGAASSIPQVHLSLAEIRRQMENWEQG